MTDSFPVKGHSDLKHLRYGTILNQLDKFYEEEGVLSLSDDSNSITDNEEVKDEPNLEERFNGFPSFIRDLKILAGEENEFFKSDPIMIEITAQLKHGEEIKSEVTSKPVGIQDTIYLNTFLHFQGYPICNMSMETTLAIQIFVITCTEKKVLIGYAEMPIFTNSGMFIYGYKNISLWPSNFVSLKDGRPIGVYTGTELNDWGYLCNLVVDFPEFSDTMIYGEKKSRETVNLFERDVEFINAKPGLLD